MNIVLLEEYTYQKVGTARQLLLCGVTSLNYVLGKERYNKKEHSQDKRMRYF